MASALSAVVPEQRLRCGPRRLGRARAAGCRLCRARRRTAPSRPLHRTRGGCPLCGLRHLSRARRGAELDDCHRCGGGARAAGSDASGHAVPRSARGAGAPHGGGVARRGCVAPRPRGRFPRASRSRRLHERRRCRDHRRTAAEAPRDSGRDRQGAGDVVAPARLARRDGLADGSRRRRVARRLARASAGRTARSLGARCGRRFDRVQPVLRLRGPRCCGDRQRALRPSEPRGRRTSASARSAP